MPTRATIETMIEEVARCIVNQGLFRAMYEHCVDNEVMPCDLTDNEVTAIISGEVCRRCPGAAQLNEAKQCE